MLSPLRHRPRLSIPPDKPDGKGSHLSCGLETVPPLPPLHLWVQGKFLGIMQSLEKTSNATTCNHPGRPANQQHMTHTLKQDLLPPSWNTDPCMHQRPQISCLRLILFLRRSSVVGGSKEWRGSGGEDVGPPLCDVLYKGKLFTPRTCNDITKLEWSGEDGKADAHIVRARST